MGMRAFASGAKAAMGPYLERQNEDASEKGRMKRQFVFDQAVAKAKLKLAQDEEWERLNKNLKLYQAIAGSGADDNTKLMRLYLSGLGESPEKVDLTRAQADAQRADAEWRRTQANAEATKEPKVDTAVQLQGMKQDFEREQKRREQLIAERKELFEKIFGLKTTSPNAPGVNEMVAAWSARLNQIDKELGTSVADYTKWDWTGVKAKAESPEAAQEEALPEFVTPRSKTSAFFGGKDERVREIKGNLFNLQKLVEMAKAGHKGATEELNRMRMTGEFSEYLKMAEEVFNDEGMSDEAFRIKYPTLFADDLSPRAPAAKPQVPPAISPGVVPSVPTPGFVPGAPVDPNDPLGFF